MKKQREKKHNDEVMKVGSVICVLRLKTRLHAITKKQKQSII